MSEQSNELNELKDTIKKLEERIESLEHDNEALKYALRDMQKYEDLYDRWLRIIMVPRCNWNKTQF